MKSKKYSFKFSLSTTLLAIVLIIVAAMGLGLWINVKNIVRTSIAQRLKDTLTFALPRFSAEDHRRLLTPQDENSAAHLRLVEACKWVKHINKDVRYLYTMRMDSQEKIWFVIDSEYGDTNQEYTPIGEEYSDASPEIYDFFKHPQPIRILKDLYTDKWGTWLTGLAMITNPDGSMDGVLGIDISAAQIGEYQRRYMLMFVVFLLILLTGAIIISTIIARRISMPIQLITADMHKIQNLELNDSLELHSSITEVVEMRDALENMKKGLRSFRKYVPADLVTELIQMKKEAVLGSEKKEISIFFSDIKDFTTMSEGLRPEQLAEMMGIYFEGMTGTLQAHHATVDKYIGDAIMAFWGAPRPEENHALLACKAALACQEFLSSNRPRWEKEGVPPFYTRIGINTGDAVVGNMGYENRLSYTALGDAVNLASRLEAMNKYYGTYILANETTYQRVKDSFLFRMVDVVAVKGRSQGARLYELVGERGAASSAVEARVNDFNQAMEAYLARDWKKSRQILERLNDPSHPDQALLMIYNRVIEYEKNPPADDWTGVVVMNQK